MFKPRFEDPIDSAKQIIENNITLFMCPGCNYWVQFLESSPIPEYKTLSQLMVISKDWNDFDHMRDHGIIEKGTHATMTYGLSQEERNLGRWWQGNLVMGNTPFAGYLSDKKWHLNEELLYSVSSLATKD